MTDTASTVLGVIGAVGAAPVVFSGVRTARRRSLAHGILLLSRTKELDVVVTTSEISRSMVGADPAQRPVRPLTASGELQGISAIANRLGRSYPSKTLTVHQSALLKQALTGDVVLLGGPVHNNCAKEFLNAVVKAHPTAGLVFDAHIRRIGLGGVVLDDIALELQDDVPVEDYALIILTNSPFTRTGRRGILCAGFTTYGTGAAAEYVFTRLLEPHSRRNARREAKTLPRSVAIILKASFSNRTPYSFEEVARTYLVIPPSSR
jgi:hypothetical protein